MSYRAFVGAGTFCWKIQKEDREFFMLKNRREFFKRRRKWPGGFLKKWQVFEKSIKENVWRFFSLKEMAKRKERRKGFGRF